MKDRSSITFRLRAAMLMRDLVLFEEFSHFFSYHLVLAGNRYDIQFLDGFRLLRGWR